ncbi:hypothetical protein SAMN05421813_11612 [Daejeonella rubra]|uniref:Lipocalin-like domain-containing protein n=1 Tax=Daejeonella rubra TaxID=990371 RepID=A0A1G9UBW7_9SPHI|nr:hypothetical protein [Daejeonella rubra]SDM57408.1 hypothetical protein SAMN05421813_11612 [Daejeonella rubra]
MKNLLTVPSFLFCLIFISSCTTSPIKGTWQYDGGLYNGREQKASPDFQMQRTYTGNTFEAFMIEGSVQPELYSSGIYEIKGDTLLITSKFSSRPSQNTDVMITYKFAIDKDKLTINGVLPNGMIVEEYWKRVK